jgi:hypothetical protein
MTSRALQRKPHSRSLLRVCRLGMAMTLVVMLAGAGTALAKRHKHRSAPAPGLADQIQKLALQLYGLPYYEAGPIPGKIQTLVLGSLSAWMNQPAASDSSSSYPLDVRVRMQLESDFSKLHYPWFGRPAVFVRPWRGGELIGAGYTLGWSDFDRVNCVALFEREGGKTQLAAVTNFVPQADLHYAFLAPAPGGNFRFITYGYILGMSQPRLSAVLYSFDGASLKDLWDSRNTFKQDLYDGKMAITGNTVTFRYLIEKEYVQAVEQNQLPPGYESIYKITPQGLTLESERQIPFQQVNTP